MVFGKCELIVERPKMRVGAFDNLMELLEIKWSILIFNGASRIQWSIEIE